MISERYQEKSRQSGCIRIAMQRQHHLAGVCVHRHINYSEIPRKKNTRQIGRPWPQPRSQIPINMQELTKEMAGILHLQMGSKHCQNRVPALNMVPFVPTAWRGLQETAGTFMTHEFHRLIPDSYWSFNLHILQSLSLAVTTELVFLEISQMRM